MSKKILFYFLILCSSLSAQSLVKRPSPSPMKTTVIIPCHFKHFIYVYDLLNHIQNQSCIPDEVVISLSESQKVSQDMVKTILNTSWSFSIKLLSFPEKQSAGQNRNNACEASSGDLLICQDADDLPHPQRVEIIKYLFENFIIDHLIHQFTRQENSFHYYNQSEMYAKSHYANKFKKIKIVDLTNGNVALTREVFSTVKWPTQHKIGEDFSFNQKVYTRFQNKVIAELDLLLYRNYLSSYNEAS